MAGMSYIEGENPKGHQLPVNPIETRKFHIVRCGREEAIANCEKSAEAVVAGQKSYPVKG